VSQTTSSNPGTSAENPWPVVRVTPDLFLAAARRLVSQTNASVEDAARRLVESAPRHGIDLTMCFATLEPAPRLVKGAKTGRGTAVVRQACLAVKGSGRTAMLFISEPLIGELEAPEAKDERVACIHAAVNHLRAFHARDVGLVQALPEPEEPWTIEACQDAGFILVGNLTYMRCPPMKAKEAQKLVPVAEQEAPWLAGVELLRCSDLPPSELDELLGEALEATYVDTLDCPELSGLRSKADVIDSHRSIGQYDPALWWLVMHERQPRGCMLLSACADQRATELVYLGLAPSLRALGMGKRLLAMGMQVVRRVHPTWAVTCAVDERNVPALKLYQRLGFEGIARRVAMVRPI
jgi:ribosomal protein S18 acetylase RimI-like enzyme